MNGGEYAFRAGEHAELSIRSQSAVVGRFFIRVRYKTGKVDTINKTFTTTLTWTAELFVAEQPFIDDGVVLNATVRLDTAAVKGTAYAGLYVTPSANSGMNVANLAQGYLHDFHVLTLGDDEQLDWPETVAYMDVTYTQANVAGGAVIVEILPGAGNAFEVVGGSVINSGTNTIRASVRTGGGLDDWRLTAVASGAATVLRFPTAGGTVNTSDSPGWPAYPVRVYGTRFLTLYQTGAGAQNDTIRILIYIRVRGALPTVSKANSTNAADVTVTAGAASFAFVT